MPRLIDADSIKSAKYHDLPYTHIHPVGVDVQAYEMGWNDALDAVADSAPTVDAEPVRHGHWILNDRGVYECSVCGRVPTAEEKQYDHYCPNCGAKMDETEERLVMPPADGSTIKIGKMDEVKDGSK